MTQQSSRHHHVPTKQPSLNFSSGTASLCLDAIITSNDLQKARERIRKEKEDGKSVTEKLKESTKITAGIVWKCGTNHLEKSVLDVMKEDQMKKFIAEKQRIEKKEKAYLKIKSEFDALISSRKTINQFNHKELMTILKSFKRAGDNALPTKKNDLIKLYHEWKDRPPLMFDYSAVDAFFLSLNNDDARDGNINSINGDVVAI